MIKVLHLIRNESKVAGGISEFVDILLSSRNEKVKHSVITSISWLNYKNSIIHVHNIWDPYNLFLYFYHCFFQVPYVIHVHGMLDSWALNQSKLKKIIFIRLFLSRFLRSSKIIFAIHDNEINQILNFSPKANVILLYNCAAEIAIGSEVEAHIKKQRQFLYIGRLDAKKNIHGLLSAWKQVANSEASLVIAGDGLDDYKNILKLYIAENSIKNVKFVGWVSGNEKIQLFKTSNFGVLVSHSEGLPISILECLSHGLPVIISNQCNLDIVEKFNAGYVVRSHIELVNALKSALKCSDDDYKSFSFSAKNLYTSKFSRSNMIQEINNAYASKIK